RVKATRQRTPDLSALPVEEIEYTLPEEERVCPQCSGEMHSIGHEVRQWLDQTARQASPKLLLGSALTYCLNQWPNLCRFLEDGRLEIDNNRSERSIKPFVIGRKNWLFANTPKGATTSAVIYSIVETAKENGLNPAAYLQHLFEQLPNIDIHDPRQLDQLLPWSEVVKERCAAPANKRA
ncbi:MAG: transposase, partial [Armatimonadetes bacterium]|nr:transposase [Armatimonadota bacterium]